MLHFCWRYRDFITCEKFTLNHTLNSIFTITQRGKEIKIFRTELVEIQTETDGKSSLIIKIYRYVQRSFRSDAAKLPVSFPVEIRKSRRKVGEKFEDEKLI